ncbi:MAG: hypothetical protein KDB14_33765, partial [Planctomycetales bacterium]|nr:hypothetical protein [Planctomycetales bacterium]
MYTRPPTRVLLTLTILLAMPCGNADAQEKEPRPLPGTAPLIASADVDFASQLVDGVDRFLLKQLAASVEQRATHWQVDVSSTESYERSIAANR